MPEDKQSTFNPGVTFFYYFVGGHEYSNIPGYNDAQILPDTCREDTILPCVLGEDGWNGTAFIGNTKALLIKEWSI